MNIVTLLSHLKIIYLITIENMYCMYIAFVYEIRENLQPLRTCNVWG